MRARVEEFVSRPFGRLFFLVWLALLLAPVGAKAESAKTLLQGPVLRADGTVAHEGTLSIEWKDFTTAEGEFVFAGRKTVTIGSDGMISIELIPNTGATPSGSFYRVLLNQPGEGASERLWVVPAVATTTPAAVWAKVVPQAVAQQSVGRDYVDSAVAASTNAGTAYVNEKLGGLATVATTGSYNDLLNKPTLTVDLTSPGPIGGTAPSTVNATSYSVNGVALASANLSDAATVAKTNQANTFSQPQTAQSVITSLSPQVDIRAYGAVIDGVSDIGPALTSAVAAACTGAGVVFLPCNGSGCYLANASALAQVNKTACSNNAQIQLKLQGTLNLGSTFVKPNDVSFVCDGGGAPGQFSPKGPNCTVVATNAHGTLGTMIASGLQTFTPSFTAGTIANLPVGSALSVIDNVTCTITSITRTSAANNNVTATVSTPCRIPPGSLATVAGVTDSSFNGAPMVIQNDYIAGTITWTQSGTAITSSGGAITGINDDSFETVKITAVSGSNVTASFVHVHNASASWGAVGMMALPDSYTGHYFQGVHEKGAYGAGFWFPHNAQVLLDGVSADAQPWPTSIPMELASTYGWRLTAGSLVTAYQYQCKFNCTQPSYPMGLRITSLGNSPDGSDLNDIIDGNTFILGGIKIDTNGNLGSGPNKIGDLRLRDVTIEQAAGYGLLIDPRNVNTYRAFTLTNVMLQDNFLMYPQCLAGYTDPVLAGSIVVNTLNATLLTGCLTNPYYGGQLTVNGIDYTQGTVGMPSYLGRVGVINDGSTLEAELRGEGAGMAPSLIPYATAGVNTNAATWTCSPCTLNPGVLAPDGSTTAAEMVTTTSAPRVEVLNYRTATTTGDAIIAGVWCMTGPNETESCLSGPWSAYQISSDVTADLFDSTTSYYYNASGGSNYVGDFWHPIVTLDYITGAGSASTHSIYMRLGGSGTSGWSKYFWQPFFIYVPYSAKPTAWSEAQWHAELARWRQQLLHGHVSPNMLRGALDIGSTYKFYWGSDTNLYRSGAGVLKTDGWLDVGTGIKCAGSTGSGGQVLSSTGSGCSWINPPTTGLADPGASGIVKRGGTAGTTSIAAASDVTGLFTGAGACYLKKDGSCDTPTGSAANATFFTDQVMSNATSISLVQNVIIGRAFNLTLPVTVNYICKGIGLADNTANLYDIGIADMAGNLLTHTGAIAGSVFAPNTTSYCNAVSGAAVTLQPGTYMIEATTNCAASCAKLSVSSATNGYMWMPVNSSTGWGSTSGGTLPASSKVPAANFSSSAFNTNSAIWFGLH